jgi:hypothetical protein
MTWGTRAEHRNAQANREKGHKATSADARLRRERQPLSKSVDLKTEFAALVV